MIRRLLPFLAALKPTRLGVLFAVLIGLGVGFWQWGRPPRPRVVLGDIDPDPGFKAYFSPDGRMVGTVAGIHAPKDEEYDFYLTLWETDTGRKLTRFYLARQNRFREKLAKVVFSPDGRTVACRYWDQIRVWDIANPQKPVIYDDRDGNNHPQVFFSPEGKLLALRGEYEIWDVASNKLVKKLLRGQKAEGAAALLGQGEVPIMRGDNTIVVWVGGTTRIWHLPTASLLVERQDLIRLEDLFRGRLSLKFGGPTGGCFLIRIDADDRFLVHEVISGKKQSYAAESWWSTSATPTNELIAFAGKNSFNKSATKPWWNSFSERLGFQADSEEYYVTLNAFPSGEELCVLKDCLDPIFSPNGRTLAVTSADGKSLQLWDLPIRKPIGKILGLAGLAAVATLLAINGLGWLRRRRMRLKANVVPHSVSTAQ